jgi:hypothetical protein
MAATFIASSPEETCISEEPLVGRFDLSSPIGFSNTHVKIKQVVAQSNSEVFEQLVIGSGRCIDKGAVVVSNLCTKPVETTTKDKFRRY